MERIAPRLYPTSSTVNVSTSLSNLKPWTAETPNLYTLVVSQRDASGNEEMAFATKTGFRDITISNKVVKINGQRVFFRGVNTQDTQPETGRSINVETMLRDIELMMRQPDPSGHYALSELQVMGRGGLSAIPAERQGMVHGRYYLNGGDWRLFRDGAYILRDSPLTTDNQMDELVKFTNLSDSTQQTVEKKHPP